MTRVAGCLVLTMALAGCGEGRERAAIAPDGAEGVQPGIAACLTAIGREDLIQNPEGEMSAQEAYDLVGCVGDRARGS